MKREREEGKIEGHTKGRIEGHAKGRLEGKAALLSTQIIRKFGVLPDWANVRLVAADDTTLPRWAEQILDAGCIEDVFK